MFPTLPPPDVTTTLDEVIARLAAHEAVDGILTMGSTGGDRLTPESDYDLFVILAEMPAPIWQVVTRVVGRLTEVYFAPVAALERLVVEGEAVPADTIKATQLGWLRTGRIVFDRAGRLERARRRAGERRVAAVRERDAYAAWYKINYNVRQTRRIVASRDPIYLAAVDFRLLYGLAELLPAYFQLRREPWPGEKAGESPLAREVPELKGGNWLRGRAVFFGDDGWGVELARRLGVSRERARQLEALRRGGRSR